MKRNIRNLRIFLNVVSAIVLLGGWGSAILIYRAAENRSTGVLGYEESGGQIYPIRPEDSKKYLRDMELYGGKLNLLVDELRRWFEGLWHGKSLVLIVAFVTAVVSLGVFYYANSSNGSNFRTK